MVDCSRKRVASLFLALLLSSCSGLATSEKVVSEKKSSEVVGSIGSKVDSKVKISFGVSKGEHAKVGQKVGKDVKKARVSKSGTPQFGSAGGVKKNEAGGLRPKFRGMSVAKKILLGAGALQTLCMMDVSSLPDEFVAGICRVSRALIDEISSGKAKAGVGNMCGEICLEVSRLKSYVISLCETAPLPPFVGSILKVAFAAKSITTDVVFAAVDGIYFGGDKHALAGNPGSQANTDILVNLLKTWPKTPINRFVNWFFSLMHKAFAKGK